MVETTLPAPESFQQKKHLSNSKTNTMSDKTSTTSI